MLGVALALLMAAMVSYCDFGHAARHRRARWLCSIIVANHISPAHITLAIPVFAKLSDSMAGSGSICGVWLRLHILLLCGAAGDLPSP